MLIAGGVVVVLAGVAVVVAIAAGRRGRALRELRAGERRFRALVESSSDVVTVMAADGTITYDSPSVTRILGFEVGDRVGTSAWGHVHPDDLARAGVAPCHGGWGAAPAMTEVRVRHADGSWRWTEAYVTDLRHVPDVAAIVVSFRDVTERKALEERLAYQAFHDPLTGLANRALFLDRVGHALAGMARTPQRRLAVLYLDLDDFKTINDGLGHAAGDAVLVEIGRRLSRCVRPSDTCARLGGDEFAVLLEGLDDPDDAYEVGVRVLETIRETTMVDGSALVLNASLGVVVSCGDEDAGELVRNADLAMYEAKGGGKGRFEVFEQGMHEAVLERLALKADLRRAVDAGEFVPHYQPIVDLATGDAIGAEALMRWEHPTRGLLTPNAFMELAEETGLIVTMGRELLYRACRDATSWPASGAGVPRMVSVNLSVRQVQEPGIVDDVRLALESSGLPPERLTLEITESLLIAEPHAAAATLRALKSLGVVLALDDFGTGYSSLAYLGRFPVDALKIDKSFIDAVLTGGVNGELVTAIVDMGRALGMKVTAEGIEQPSQVAGLVGIGCRLGQGYHFAAPMPVAALAQLWAPAGGAETEAEATNASNAVLLGALSRP